MYLRSLALAERAGQVVSTSADTAADPNVVPVDLAAPGVSEPAPARRLDMSDGALTDWDTSAACAAGTP